jgi:hypothetical protein
LAGATHSQIEPHSFQSNKSSAASSTFAEARETPRNGEYVDGHAATRQETEIRFAGR